MLNFEWLHVSWEMLAFPNNSISFWLFKDTWNLFWTPSRQYQAIFDDSKKKQHLGNATPWNFVSIRNIYEVQFARKWVTNTLIIESKFFVGKGGCRQAIFYESAFNVKAGVFSWSLVFGFKEEGFTLTSLVCKTMTAYSWEIFIVKWDTIWSNLHVNLRVNIWLEQVIISS